MKYLTSIIVIISIYLIPDAASVCVCLLFTMGWTKICTNWRTNCIRVSFSILLRRFLQLYVVVVVVLLAGTESIILRIAMGKQRKKMLYSTAGCTEHSQMNGSKANRRTSFILHEWNGLVASATIFSMKPETTTATNKKTIISLANCSKIVWCRSLCALSVCFWWM